jgi:hypothetical protein
MKKLCIALGLALAASPVLAHDGNRNHGNPPTATTVRWLDIIGVITAQGVANPISDNISSGTFAWSTSSGNARVDLATGAASFDVQGLVINGTAFSGTPGPVTAVTGTLVCNPGDQTEMAIDTAAVPLDAQGDAKFNGTIPAIPAVCANPLFLVRIAVPAGAAGRWIATGAVRVTGQQSQ